MRYALIAPNEMDSASTIDSYMPGNYRLLASGPFGHYIVGEDRAGWTMDEYVIPRLASGLIFAREVRGTEIEIAYSECAMHSEVAGHKFHVIEDDTFLNGNTIPEAERTGCYVIDTRPHKGGTRVPMLKSEAGWRA